MQSTNLAYFFGSEDILLCRQPRIEIYYHIDIFHYYLLLF